MQLWWQWDSIWQDLWNISRQIERFGQHIPRRLRGEGKPDNVHPMTYKRSKYTSGWWEVSQSSWHEGLSAWSSRCQLCNLSRSQLHCLGSHLEGGWDRAALSEPTSTGRPCQCWTGGSRPADGLHSRSSPSNPLSFPKAGAPIRRKADQEYSYYYL